MWISENQEHRKRKDKKNYRSNAMLPFRSNSIVCPSVCLCACLFFCLSACLCLCFYVCLSANVSACESLLACLSVRLLNCNKWASYITLSSSVRVDTCVCNSMKHSNIIFTETIPYISIELYHLPSAIIDQGAQWATPTQSSSVEKIWTHPHFGYKPSP